MSADVLVVGRPTCDLVFTGLDGWPAVGREVYAAGMTLVPGGAFNLVAALHRLDLRVELIGTVGNDSWSRYSVAAMATEGVSARFIQTLDQPLPSVSVCVTHGGDRGFVTHEPMDAEMRSACSGHALGVLRSARAAFLQCCLNVDLAAYARLAHERGMRVIVDCGWDEHWLGSREIKTLMPLADIVFTNTPEAHCITGTNDTDLALRRLGDIVPFVVVKRGAEGASALVQGQEYHAPTDPVTVVDATGAGDCFNAGFLLGLHHGLAIEQCLRLGNICGGLAVAVPGGFSGAPTLAELRTRAEDLGITLPEHTPIGVA